MKVLLFGIARQRMVLPSGAVLDLRPEKEWRRLVSTLRAQVPVTRPPLYREHDDGRPALGYVSAVVGPVSREQLSRGGVPGAMLRAPEYVLFRAELTARGAVEYAAGDIARTSIGIAFDVTDDTGRVWPYYLDELSVVDKPHVRVQPTARDLSRVALRAGVRGVVRLSGAVLPRRHTMDAMQVIDRLQAFLADLAAEAAPAEETPEAIPAEEGADGILAALEEPPEDLGMAYEKEEEDLAARVSALEAALAAKEAELSAQKLSARINAAGVKLSSEDRAALLRIGSVDEPAFGRMLERLAAATPRTQERLAAAGPAKAELPPPATRQEASLRKLAELAAAKVAGGAA